MKNDDCPSEIYFPFVVDANAVVFVVDEVRRLFVFPFEKCSTQFSARFSSFAVAFCATERDKVHQHVSNIFNKWKAFLLQPRSFNRRRLAADVVDA